MPSSHPGRRNARRTPAPTSVPASAPARGPTGGADPRPRPTPARPGAATRAVAARRYHRWPPVRRYGPWLLGAEVLATGWSLSAIAAFEAGHGTWALGAGQRLQVLLVALWLAPLAVAVGLPGRTGPSGGDAAGPPGAVAEGAVRDAPAAAAPSRTERRDPV
ncbi:hypothetical protein [Kitasatospora purpeofusca]|uniref:hypothetical protein n=1 Tax=Kitasatospora purpeofusca TaxID=67352 RepID=UPI002E27BDEF|nr:hypothetical protein [Kitasatospora purpeofusca]